MGKVRKLGKCKGILQQVGVVVRKSIPQIFFLVVFPVECLGHLVEVVDMVCYFSLESSEVLYL